MPQCVEDFCVSKGLRRLTVAALNTGSNSLVKYSVPRVLFFSLSLSLSRRFVSCESNYFSGCGSIQVDYFNLDGFW